MKHLKWVAILVMIVFALGFLTGRIVYHQAPLIPVGSDTTVTDSTVLTWEYTIYSDTTIKATITESNDKAGDNSKPDSGRNASTRIKYEDGEILEIIYSYDKEIFDVRRYPAPRPIRTNFITREIKTYIPIERPAWDRPGITFASGCIVGAGIILLTASVLGG